MVRLFNEKLMNTVQATYKGAASEPILVGIAEHHEIKSRSYPVLKPRTKELYEEIENLISKLYLDSAKTWKLVNKEYQEAGEGGECYGFALKECYEVISKEIDIEKIVKCRPEEKDRKLRKLRKEIAKRVQRRLYRILTGEEF